MSKSALVVEHRAWHVPDHYARFAEMLRAKSTLEDDVQVVKEVLSNLANEGKEIIVIAHSYGGAVATDALRGMSYEERKINKLSGGVKHVIYMLAFMLRPGESAFSASQPRPDPDPVEPREDGTSFLCQSPKQLFYGDVEDRLAKECEAMLVRHSLAALAGPVSYPNYVY